MHEQQTAFIRAVIQQFSAQIKYSIVDFGSLDVNGNNRQFFPGMDYIGIDLGEGRNVDVVCRAHEYVPDRKIGCVISTEMLEHDKYWADSIRNAIDILEPGGLFVFSCASTGRGEHGVTEAWPEDAPFTNDYYHNLTAQEIENAVDLSRLGVYEFRYNPNPGDLYFWGVKK